MTISQFPGHSEAVGAKSPSASPSFTDVWVKEYKDRQEFYKPTELQMPSGKTVKVARMPLHLMWSRGLVPDSLTARVQDWIEAVDDESETKFVDELAVLSNDELIQRYVSWVDLLDFVWCTCVKAPTFVMTESEQNVEFGRLWVGEVDMDDKTYLFSFVQGVDQSVEDFFRQQGEALGELPDGEGLRVQAERVLWVERRGGRVAGVYDRPSDVPMGTVYPESDRRDEDGAHEERPQDTDGASAEVHAGGNQPLPKRTTGRAKKTKDPAGY